MNEFENEIKKVLSEFENKVKIEGEIRDTRMGALSDSFLFVVGKGQVVADDIQYSRTGRHGLKIWYLTPEEAKKAMLVKLHISNTGKRSVEVINAPIPEIESYIIYMWCVQKAFSLHIAQKLDEVFKHLKL